MHGGFIEGMSHLMSWGITIDKGRVVQTQLPPVPADAHGAGTGRASRSGSCRRTSIRRGSASRRCRRQSRRSRTPSSRQPACESGRCRWTIKGTAGRRPACRPRGWQCRSCQFTHPEPIVEVGSGFLVARPHAHRKTDGRRWRPGRRPDRPSRAGVAAGADARRVTTSRRRPRDGSCPETPARRSPCSIRRVAAREATSRMPTKPLARLVLPCARQRVEAVGGGRERHAELQPQAVQPTIRASSMTT